MTNKLTDTTVEKIVIDCDIVEDNSVTKVLKETLNVFNHPPSNRTLTILSVFTSKNRQKNK